MSDSSLSGFDLHGTTEDEEALSFALPAMESGMLAETSPGLAGSELRADPSCSSIHAARAR